MAIKVSNTTVIDDSRNLTNIGTISATGNVTFSGSGALQLPAGTSAEQPGSPSAGMIRWNTDTGSLEIYNGSAFAGVSGGGGGGATDASTFFIATA